MPRRERERDLPTAWFTTRQPSPECSPAPHRRLRMLRQRRWRERARLRVRAAASEPRVSPPGVPALERDVRKAVICRSAVTASGAGVRSDVYSPLGFQSMKPFACIDRAASICSPTCRARTSDLIVKSCSHGTMRTFSPVISLPNRAASARRSRRESLGLEQVELAGVVVRRVDHRVDRVEHPSDPLRRPGRCRGRARRRARRDPPTPARPVDAAARAHRRGSRAIVATSARARLRG